MLKKNLLLVLLFIATSTFAQKKWTLEECVAYAYKNNIAIKSAKLDSLSARIDKKAAIGNFLPSLSANSTHAWNIGLTQNITTGILENQTTQNTSLGLSSQVDIYKGLENVNRLRRANLSIIAAQHQIARMKDDVGLNVANAFLQIIFNKENLKVQIEQLLNNEKQLIRSTELVNAGVVPRGDLLDIKATVASNKQSVVIAENNLMLSKMSLAQLLQLKDFQNFDVSDVVNANSTTVILDQNPTVIFEKARQARYEIKIANTNIDIANKDIAIAKSAYQPSLRAFYNFGTRAGYNDRVVGFTPNTANPFSPIGIVQSTGQVVVQPNFNPVLGSAESVFDQFSQYKGHSFGLQMNIPIFNGFATRNNVARSKVNKDRTEIALQQAEVDLERNVFTAITNAKGAKNTYESALTALEARQEAFNYAKERYAVGLMNSFDFNQSQTLFTNAQSEVLRTKYDYIFKVKIVELYFGIKVFN